MDKQMAVIKGIDLRQVKVLEVERNRLETTEWLKDVILPKLLMLSLSIYISNIYRLESNQGH
jgi:hypothetical protein